MKASCTRSYSWFFLIGLLFSNLSQGATLITGDSAAAPNTSFSQPIKSFVPNTFGNTFYVGAAAAGLNNFAISATGRGATQFVPIAPETVKLNNQVGQPNPLFNKGIAYLALMEGVQIFSRIDSPVAVPADDLTSVYVISSYDGDTANVLSVAGFKDAANMPQVTSGIIALGAGASGAIFAAVKPHAAPNFGPVGSGIAVVVQQQDKAQEVTVVDGQEQTTQKITQSLKQLQGKAFPCDITSGTIKINGDLAGLNVVDMHWDPIISRLYLALAVQAGAGVNDGARAVVIGRLTQRIKPGDETKKPEEQQLEVTFELQEVAPVSAFQGTQQIIGGVGSGQQFTVNKLRTLWNSSRLNYLIVVGGNGDAVTTARSVYSLPLVRYGGMLAHKNGDPYLTYAGSTGAFTDRYLVQLAVNPADLLTQDDVDAQVGGPNPLSGDITDILVENDTVFVSVATGDAPGVYYSQALLDTMGRIKGWTVWQRCFGTHDSVFGLGFDPVQGTTIMLFGADAMNINTVKQTQWGYGAADLLAPLGAAISTALPQKQGGVQGIVDLPIGTPGLDDIALLVATGNNTVVLAQTAQGTMPTAGYEFNTVTNFSNGTVTAAPDPETRIVTMSGGVLGALGPIVAVEVGAIATDGYLFAGGVNGLAVLITEAGFGWAGTLGSGFNGLVDGMQFKKIGAYSSIRKLIADGNYLYILTDSTLDCLDFSLSDFATGNLAAVTLARANDLLGASGSFLDVLVSNKLALLATSNGLLRVGDGKDISIAGNQQDVAWTQLVLPESVGPVTRLIARPAASTREQDFASQGGSMVFALNAYEGKNRAQLYRLTIADTSGANGITSATVQLVSDIFIKGITTYFVNFGAYKNYSTTDGILYFTARDRTQVDAVSVNLLPPGNLDRANMFPPGLRSGDKGVARQSLFVPLDFGQSDSIVRILRSSASGSWLVAGDFGLRINE